MNKHTPGPWHWDSDPIKCDPLGRSRYRVTTIGKTITQHYYSSDDPRCEADTKLIAAAPDLLASLQAMVDRYCDDESLDSPIDEAARAAIAKATS